MLLDFNTLESQKQNSVVILENQTVSPASGLVSRTQAFLLALALSFSVFALAGVLYTLSHIPEPEPISIQCSPDLLKKIENQAKILEEIAKTTKPKN